MSDRNAWGFTIFADDLRHEIGGKISLIGIYQQELILPIDFPIELPRLVLFIKYYEVRGQLKDDLIVKIFFPGDPEDTPTLFFTIPHSARDNATSLYEPDTDTEILFDLTIPISLSPVHIKEEGFVKIRVQCGNAITRLGRLMIRKARDGDNVPSIPSPIASPPPSSQPPTSAPAS